MRTALRIAWRYLFAKKTHNAINIVSGVSAAGVAVVTAALVIVLSVMNGFGTLVERMFSAFDPDLSITACDSKHFTTDTEVFRALRERADISVFSETVEETALVRFSGRQVPARLKGVDENFRQLTQIDSIMTDGTFSVTDWYTDPATGLSTRAFERCVPGIGLANQIGIGAHFVSPVKFYVPKRTGSINMLRPDKSLNEGGAFISGIFAVNQTKYDDNYMLVSLPLARQLFDYGDNEVTAVELKLADGARPARVKKELRQLLGEDFRVLDRYEQQEDYFRIMEIEKLMTILLMAFILLIASFNIIGSLSMLMIDQREDTSILSHLGAGPDMVRRIFLYEGWLISLLGAAAGMLLGIGMCLVQEKFGLLKLGDGTEYIISAYPVDLQMPDLLLTAALVSVLGFAAAWIPSRQAVART